MHRADRRCLRLGAGNQNARVRPDRCVAAVSGNIIKNVNSVTVPNTGGMRGVKASVAAGVTVGNSDNLLDVLGDVDDDGRARIQEYLGGP